MAAARSLFSGLVARRSMATVANADILANAVKVYSGPPPAPVPFALRRGNPRLPRRHRPP